MDQPITKITYCPNIALVTLPAVPDDSKIVAEIFTSISNNGINVDMISQTAPQGGTISIAFSISMDSMAQLLPVINSLKPLHPGLKCEINGGMSKINFYDADMVNTPGVAARVFAALADGDIRVVMITTSTVDISLLVQEHDATEALTLCGKAFGVEPEEVPFE
jgi:aspartokinase